MKSFNDIIKSKSTKELLDIYDNHYLEYQETFIDLCAEELRRRGVNITSSTLDFPEELKPQILEMMKRQIYKGESSINITRKLCRYGYKKEDFEDLLVQAKHQAAIMKMEGAILKNIRYILIGLPSILIILLLFYIDSLTGYTTKGIFDTLAAMVIIVVPIKIIISIILIIWYSIKIKIKKKNPPTSKTISGNTLQLAIQ